MAISEKEICRKELNEDLFGKNICENTIMSYFG